MDAEADHEPQPQPSARRTLREWLGLAPAANPAPEPDAPPAAADPLQSACRRVAHEIGEFLAEHRLPPTSLTLAAALDCVAGNDPRLADHIRARRESGQPITPEWLAEARRPSSPEDEIKAVTRLMDRLESSLADFGQTTLDARTATSEYTSALTSHVDDLTAAGQAAALTEMVALTRAMLDRTHRLEAQIARSEAETRALHRSLEDARRNAEIDHLTGLPNRRAFETRLEREVIAARTAHEPLCVAFCDIDRFKRINDTHGHDAGDRILKVVAHALNEMSDDKCHVARHGGEEFVVLLRGHPLADAYHMLDEMREHLADRRMVNRATEVPFGKVTFSAGLADVLSYPTPREALKAADEALYVAKQEGRNRIVRAPARLTPVASPKANPKAA
jgi:diguanylate cyclase